METKLARIAEISKERPKEKLTSLYHYLNEEFLTVCHQVTKSQYEENLEENIQCLVNRLKRGGYRPQPVRRAYIRKDEKPMRSLGIPAYEDKIVQRGLTKIMRAIYEADFLDCSYGFRPGRGCHGALRELNRTIEWGKISYVVDADIRDFFTQVDHKWLMDMISLRIADPNLKRLIVKFLKAGVMEAGIKDGNTPRVDSFSFISQCLSTLCTRSMV